eukprot:33413-Amphidinium_carterae.1
MAACQSESPWLLSFDALAGNGVLMWPPTPPLTSIEWHISKQFDFSNEFEQATSTVWNCHPRVTVKIGSRVGGNVCCLQVGPV